MFLCFKTGFNIINNNYYNSIIISYLLQSDGCIEENSDPESQAAMTGSLQ